MPVATILFQSRIATAQRGVASRGLAPASASATGTLIVYATAPGQTADDGAGDDSPFTTALLHYIDEPGLEVRQMLSRVRREVRTATHGAQIPWESSSLEGDFFFRPAALAKIEPHAVQPVVQPAAPPPASALAAPPPEQNIVPSRANAGASPQLPAVPAAPPGTAPMREALARPPSTPAAPPHPIDVTPPASALPAASKVVLNWEVPHFRGMTDTAAGAVATMRVVNTSTRCGVQVRQPGNTPFRELSLIRPPGHGNVALEPSAFYYTPSAGFVGSDEFSIVSSPSGHVRVFVTVLSPEALR